MSDICWFTPAGVEMTDADWQMGFARTVGLFLNGKAITTPDDRGEPVVDDSFFLLFNAHSESIEFTLPSAQWGERWSKVIDTNDPIPDLRNHTEVLAGEPVRIEAHAVVVLKR